MSVLSYIQQHVFHAGTSLGSGLSKASKTCRQSQRPLTDLPTFPNHHDIPIAVANIGWHAFIIFAILNATFIPTACCLYPETQDITLENIPLLFHKGGVTGSVLTSQGGKTAVPHQHAMEAHVDEKIEEQREEGIVNGTVEKS